MSESIGKKIERYKESIKSTKTTGPNTRYKSWEWCHNEFIKFKEIYFRSTSDSEKEKIIDYLSLHLGFFLASWGMYRGSSFLLQRDYKTHHNAVREILNPIYRELWDLQPKIENINYFNDLVFNSTKGIYWKIRSSYSVTNDLTDENDDFSTETLTSKILMCTFACMPAFDRFFKEGIKRAIVNNIIDKDLPYKFTTSLECHKNNSVSNTNTYKALLYFAAKHKKELVGDNSFNYPLMKYMDMLFWEIGYEIDLAKGIEGKNVTRSNKCLVRAKELGLTNSTNKITAIAEIYNKN